MKKMKRLVALALSVVMVLAMSATAFAATITITGGEKDSEYAAYKLLDLTTSGTENYAYTLNSKYAEILKEVTQKDKEEDVISYISGLGDDAIRTFADTVYKKIVAGKIEADATTNNDSFANVEQGYYLIAETKVGTTSGSTSLVMLSTAAKEDISVTTKEDVPTVEKKVKDTNDSTGETSEWQDSADADVGDEIDYQLTGTVSKKIDSYKEYYYQFVDTMENLTYVDASVNVTVDGVDCTGQFTTEWNKDSKTLTVTCSDLKALKGVTVNKDTKVIVTYKAKLDESAKVGSEGNPNTVYLKYSNNPYDEGTGTPSTGETPKDKNIVFTYKTIVNKVDDKGNALTGATFTLEKFVADENGNDTYKGKTGSWVAQKQVETTPGTTFTFSGLDDGYYRLKETKAPDGYNKIEDIYFEISATHDITADDPELTELVGTSEKAKFSGDKKEGSLSTNVVNKSGSQLPSTGGIGTTIFYVIGGILMVGAAVLLITKRRAEN